MRVLLRAFRFLGQQSADDEQRSPVYNGFDVTVSIPRVVQFHAHNLLLCSFAEQHVAHRHRKCPNHQFCLKENTSYMPAFFPCVNQDGFLKEFSSTRAYFVVMLPETFILNIHLRQPGMSVHAVLGPCKAQPLPVQIGYFLGNLTCRITAFTGLFQQIINLLTQPGKFIVLLLCHVHYFPV